LGAPSSALNGQGFAGSNRLLGPGADCGGDAAFRVRQMRFEAGPDRERELLPRRDKAARPL